MPVKVVRQISAILVTLTLVFGPAVSGANASVMGGKMTAAASSDMPLKCGDCGMAKGATCVGMCSAAFCGGLIIFTSAGNDLPDVQQLDTLAPYDARRMSGHISAPDPYPPRPTILS